MNYEKLTLNKKRDVTLACYRLDSSKELNNAMVRPAILIFPGGGYAMCSDRESEPIAMAYLAQGYHAFVLRYSVGENHTWPNPLDDAEQALGLIRENAADWGVDPERIAVIGFSAGGHLAAAISMLSDEKPNATILCYPAIQSALMKYLDPDIPGLEGKATPETPPAFIFTTANDGLVPAVNSLQVASDLAAQGVPYEIHIFQDGMHGMSLGKPHTCGGFKEYANPNVSEWFGLSLNWLTQVFGEFSHADTAPAWEQREEAEEE